MKQIRVTLSVLTFTVATLPVTHLLRASTILSGGSETSGSTAEDFNDARTHPAEYVASDATLLNALQSAFPTYNFQSASALGLTSVSMSDFSLSLYQPWVINNNRGTNGVPLPNGKTGNRSITGQDAGGADFLLNYAPSLPSDPTSINFVQGFITNINGSLGSEKVDNGGSTNPFYNVAFPMTAGTGNTTGGNPIAIPAAGSAWVVDIPYRCESGAPAGTNCGGGGDDVITYAAQDFTTFVTGTYTNNGTTYNVLYGGIQWGYTYYNRDFQTFGAPEPSTIATVLAAAATLWLRGFARFRTPRRY